MSDNLFMKLSKLLVFGLFLFNVIGCGNSGATSAHSKPVAGNAPPKAENRLAEDKGKAIPVKTEMTTAGYRNGDKYLAKYQNDPAVRQMILVEQSEAERSTGKLYLLVKKENDGWRELLQCKAFLGKNGIDKAREGDARTPTGDYGMLMAFGAKDDPGSLVPYTKLTDTMYLCGDKEYYNRFIDVSKVRHTCSNNSEHLIRYIPQYNYALFFDYNKDNIYGKGSAIFLHCFGSYPYTMGCVSVSEENMIKILKTVDKNARVCIYPYK